MKNNLWYQMKDEYENFLHGQHKALVKALVFYAKYKEQGGTKTFQPLEDLTQ